MRPTPSSCSLPEGTILLGRFYFGKERVYGRFTEARIPSGESYKICMELYDGFTLGMTLEEGSTTDRPLIAGIGNVRAMRRFGVDEAFSRIELAAEPGGEVPRVCMLPELGALFVFDSPLLPGGVEVQARERFVDVSVGTRSFTVIAPADLQTGERFKVVARFADGVTPGAPPSSWWVIRHGPRGR
ncbi:DUF2381 family protein [Archangium sp.]|uniref:DUF2381 family protein n=1 Tax=Archangium sp. TaxID=1872627 RepID=UPI002D2A3C15|nr:DUF2381 family protein [Archangium sp.]HYO52619.1 DUF2381 family protein [Archangium sp.]